MVKPQQLEDERFVLKLNKENLNISTSLICFYFDRGQTAKTHHHTIKPKYYIKRYCPFNPEVTRVTITSNLDLIIRVRRFLGPKRRRQMSRN